MTSLLGIDIGGSGVKGAMVDLAEGTFTSKRLRIVTPNPSTPENVCSVVAKIISHFRCEVGDGQIGLTVPGPVVHGTIPMIANLHPSWAGLNAEKFFTERLERDVILVNDADAAGLAETHFGAAKNHPGVVIMTTLGTGIGSALIHDGVLLPNSELGHIELDGHDAESQASAGYMERKKLDFKTWAKALDRYYQTLEKLFYPDLFVVGGGVSKQHAQFLPLLHLRTPIVPAVLRNRAGIVGAAWYANAQVDGRTTSA